MDLGGLDLNLLVALDALLSERSVTRAARRVGLSQPGMSNALARLRRQCGDPLLVRQGAVLVPTSRAEALAGPVREALALIRGALDDPVPFDPARDRRSFRVSCSDYTVLMLIGPLVRTLASEAPGVAVEVLPRLADADRALRDADVDLVVEPTEIMGQTDLPGTRLWEDRWVCCVGHVVVLGEVAIGLLAGSAREGHVQRDDAGRGGVAVGGGRRWAGIGRLGLGIRDGGRHRLQRRRVRGGPGGFGGPGGPRGP